MYFREYNLLGIVRLFTIYTKIRVSKYFNLNHRNDSYNLANVVYYYYRHRNANPMLKNNYYFI